MTRLSLGFVPGVHHGTHFQRSSPRIPAGIASSFPPGPVTLGPVRRSVTTGSWRELVEDASVRWG